MEYGPWKKQPDQVDLEEPVDPISGLYRAIWGRLGGRPYTYMIRDAWHQYPLLIILFGGFGLVSIGSLLGHLFW